MKEKKKLRERIAESKVFQFAKDKLPDLAGKGLEIFGDITGKESIEGFGKWLQGEPNVSEEDKKQIAELMQQELKELEIIESNLTERHKNDMLSDSWLSKNVRPLVVLNFTLLINVVIVAGIFGKQISDVYIDMIIMVSMNVLSFYFAGREISKRNKMKYGSK